MLLHGISHWGIAVLCKQSWQAEVWTSARIPHTAQAQLCTIEASSRLVHVHCCQPVMKSRSLEQVSSWPVSGNRLLQEVGGGHRGLSQSACGGCGRGRLLRQAPGDPPADLIISWDCCSVPHSDLQIWHLAGQSCRLPGWRVKLDAAVWRLRLNMHGPHLHSQAPAPHASMLASNQHPLSARPQAHLRPC